MSPLVQAVRALRAHFGDSQQAFAERLGISIRAVANYEKDREPTGRALVELSHAASKASRHDLGSLFSSAIVRQLGPKAALRIPEIELELLLLHQDLKNGTGTPTTRLKRAELKVAEILAMVEPLNPETTNHKAEEFEQ